MFVLLLVVRFEPAHSQEKFFGSKVLTRLRTNL
jgi:hypothetical protein